MGLLHSELVALVDDGDKFVVMTQVADEPNVWMFVGVNGVGKTTTIAKVAQRETDALGHSVVLAAADTFRAAAAEVFGALGGGDRCRDRARRQEGADPGSVVFHAMSGRQPRRRLVLVYRPQAGCTPRST